jgi:hypothetical protein
MKQYRSAQGKMVDITSLAAKNERVRAVGNMKVNARGDTIDSTGKIIVPATQKVGERYQKTVGNKSAQTVKKQQPPIQQVRPKPELTKDELDLESTFNDDLEVEQIKANEGKN